MSNEELKPCPFCGKAPVIYDHTGQCKCISKHEYIRCNCNGVTFEKEKWNSSYCWKELDTLRKQNEELKAENYKLGYVTHENIDLKKELTEAVEVLEKIYTRFKEWVPRSAYEKDENLMFEAKEFLEKIKNADCL